MTSVENLSESELLAKIAKRDQSRAIRKDGRIKMDDWYELCNRNGTRPMLSGVLGSVHFTLELVTNYRCVLCPDDLLKLCHCSGLQDYWCDCVRISHAEFVTDHGPHGCAGMMQKCCPCTQPHLGVV